MDQPVHLLSGRRAGEGRFALSMRRVCGNHFEDVAFDLSNTFFLPIH